MKAELRVKDAVIVIVADRFDLEQVKSYILEQRLVLERYIEQDPFFQTTYEPLLCKVDAPEIVKLMCSAGETAGIGPMSAVAGTVSYLTAKYLLENGSKWAVVENGGDIAMKVDEPYTIGLYAGESGPRNVGLQIQPTDGILGICTSSGTVGHSVSLGVSDAATVISYDIPLADSCATLLGNQVKERNPTDEQMDSYLDSIKDKPGIQGALLMVGEKIAMWGELPKIVAI